MLDEGKETVSDQEALKLLKEGDQNRFIEGWGWSNLDGGAVKTHTRVGKVVEIIEQRMEAE